ncbi:50S ribosomal protein L14e [Sulfolobus sp. S-194]|uniref:50S ribosomal protein L14e n=1 Tax=Sulfolobus sp. S-194 TaxID=2512240 RepID=UPI0014372A04|nr:50S ribosomal protein L14e [Sulfolobus sp. S-194]QIW23247.1 50S ribosomal protein L14e [Sulfolobus sp. S-194]
MPAIEIGRICVKTRGREAGKKCVIVDIIDENFVLVTGPKDVNKAKRRRVNILHLEPTDKKIDINKGASDDEVKKKLEEAGLIEFMKQDVKPKIPVI